MSTAGEPQKPLDPNKMPPWLFWGLIVKGGLLLAITAGVTLWLLWR